MRHFRFRFFHCLFVLLPIALGGAAWVLAAPKPSSNVANAVSGAVSIRDEKISVPAGTSTPTPKPRADQTAFVEGLIFDGRTKKPLAGVAVTLAGNDDFFETTTGADGRYRFDHVVPSGTTYAWSASASGYGGRSTYRRTAPEFDVPKRGFKLDMALLRAGVVRGKVRDIKGSPVVGAEVWISNLQGDDDDSVMTDDKGVFERRDLLISPRKGGDLYEIRVENPRLSVAEAKVLVPPRYQANDEINVPITMKPRALISGQLKFRGKPFRDGLVIVEIPGGYGSEVAATDQNGRYHVSVSAPARYKISLSSDDVVEQQVQVSVLPGRATALNREMKPFPFGSMRGRLTTLSGRPIKGAGIDLHTDAGGETVSVASTDAQGRFFIAKVRPNTYGVEFSVPDSGSTWVEGVRVRSYRTTKVFQRADTILPQMQIMDTIPTVLKPGGIAFHLRASDNQGLRFAHLEVDGEWANYQRKQVSPEFAPEGKPAPRHAKITLRWDARAVANGEHTLKISVSDVAGNEVSRSFKVQVKDSPFQYADQGVASPH